MKNIKLFNLFLLTETVKRDDLLNFINDFGFFITMNLSKINSYAIDDNSKKELEEMQKNIRKPVINGKTYVELLNEINIILNNPKYLSVFLLQIKNFLEYIEPRVNKHIKDSEIKDKWLSKIDKLKKDYLKIIQ